MKLINCAQGSPEWVVARCGIPTASNFDKIVDSDGKPSKQRKKYLHQLAGERITGKPEECYQNFAMQRGKELEAEARSFYEMTTEKKIEQVGLCVADGEHTYAASPDGLIDGDGSIEIKCPMMATHVAYLLNGALPLEYFQQINGQLLVTGREWTDFVSYYPGMNPLVIRVFPDKDFQGKLKSEIESFCAELDELVKKIR